MIALLALLVLIVVVVVVTQKTRQDEAGAGFAARSGNAPRRPAPRPAASVADDLDRWVAAGLLAPDQAKAILEHEGSRPPPEVLTPQPTAPAVHGPSSRFPLAAEALGYLGGALALTGLVLVLVHYWPDLAWAGRLALTGWGRWPSSPVGSRCATRPIPHSSGCGPSSGCCRAPLRPSSSALW